MGQSYRIRTTPGDDKNIVIQVDQDFEQLEILSLKIRQEDVYDRMCSDYGVIAGRVYANNGYGIPNAKIAVFIPVTEEDLLNPNISAVYPFKNLEQTNEDGYRFNILPYSPAYDGHIATGTFPTRLDVLNNETVSYLYDKYYKYTVTTNESGDYMIFGVPVGTQTIVMNVDLSDIGQFSMTPQDLIRMGIAGEGDFDGVNFKQSPNFNILPQILVINKTIEIVPFWGQPETCQIGITRSDFDLTSEGNIEIKPTAIFMGSLMSSHERSSVKTNGVPQKTTGNLCKMIAGPGEIIGITQTIDLDSNGLPILVRADLPDSGKLIDSDGAWLFDLPMNLDYVYTNEFGEQVLSQNPKVGVPTRGKYRFKIKWQQSKNLNEDFKRGYFLVPNIREKGWDDTKPGLDPLNSPGTVAYDKAQKSYAFSLDWSDYTTDPVSVANTDILEAINCEDTFYDFDYNKVYTVSEFIDNEKSHRNRARFIGIKQIEDDTCQDTTNRYPVNDAVFSASIQFIIFQILIFLIKPMLRVIILLYSVLAFVWAVLVSTIFFALCLICGVIYGLTFGSVNCTDDVCDLLGDESIYFPPLRLPMITYPDCDMCDCQVGSNENYSQGQVSPTPVSNQSNTPTYGFFVGLSNTETYRQTVLNNFPTLFPSFSVLTDLTPVLKVLSGEGVVVSNGVTYSTNQLPFSERINSFNVKAKYYDDNGGVNQISVRYDPSNSTNSSSHYDNTLTFIIPINLLGNFSASTMFTMVDPRTSADPNITGNTENQYGTNNTSGTTVYPSQVTMSYSNPSNRVGNLQKIYTLPTNFTDTLVYSNFSDIEYYQVITGLTINEFINSSNATPLNGSFGDILKGSMTITKTGGVSQTVNFKDVINGSQYAVLVVQRGVDPYSPLYNTEIGLGRLFGYTNHSNNLITTPLRLNIPIKNIDTTLGGANGDEMLFMNNLATNNSTPNNGQNLFFNSYIFTPSTDYLPYNTTFHNFYSRLDSSCLTVPPPVFVSNPLLTYVNNVVFNNTKDVTSKTINRYYSTDINNSDSNYTTNESLVGGTYRMGTSSGDYKFSPIYPLTNSLSMSDRTKIVMRSDRLPSTQNIQATNDNVNLLQENTNTTVYVVRNGTVVALITYSPVQQYNTDYDPSYTANTAGIQATVFETFECTKMKSLFCYESSGLGFQPIRPCKYNYVKNGCYEFVKLPLFGLIIPIAWLNDFQILKEYLNRLQYFYQLCQNAVSSIFMNNWINGNLYAYPFKVVTYFNSNNQVRLRKYPKKLVVLHEKTNNFYYRSSPYTQNRLFIGAPSITPTKYGSNVRNLKNPTTILNMGPKSDLLRKTVLSSNFDGYNIDNISQTSYNNQDDLLSYYVYARLTNSDFIQSASNVVQIFNRPGQRIDGDFAQAIGINSQIGVVPFDGDTYSSNPPNPAIIIVRSAASYLTYQSNILLGVYFSSTTNDIQIRDLISPGRVIRNNATNTFPCDYLTIKSQVVPNYKWKIENDTTMWGNSFNEWATDMTDIVQNIQYQKLDRRSSGYPIAGSISDDNNIRGYLYNVNVNGDYQTRPNATPNPALGGAPWYFYFGVTKGKTAINRFYTAYLGETNLNE
jgi:hypothetical protein